MDQQKLYQQSAAAQGPRRDYSPALVARDRFVLERIREEATVNRPLEIAELSVGDGRMTLGILGAFPSARLTCAELSELRIDQLRREIAGEPSLSGRMPEFASCNFDTDFDCFASETFDAVVALDIMEHVFDVFGFVENCRRILKTDGRLFLRVPNIAYVKHRLELLRGRLPATASWFGPRGDLSAWRDKHGWDGGHLHFFTVPVLRRLLQEGGLVIESCDDPGTKWVVLRRLWPNLLFSNPLMVARKK